ncbi:hypothetical protein Fcan01_19996 [Folsomia candida]|uniref:Uncharacterized protein n=1 Tax=Folsomia candida TaxID=158441 RepID=A0A226DKY4_FOLCA|nr:hypothetical protein Fcan01_19996 [Folsomia candida]
MFNKRTLKVIGIYMKTFALLGSNPYKWDEANECVVECNSLSRKISFGFAVGHTVLYLAYLWWRLVQLLQTEKPSFPDVVWIYIWINLFQWSLTTFYNGHRKKSEVVPLFRGLKKLSTMLEKENPSARMKNLIWKFNIIDLNFLAAMWVPFIYNVSVTLMFIMIPTRVHYLYSLVSQENNRTSCLFQLFLMFEAYSKAAQSCMMGTDGFTVFPTLLSSGFWLDFTRKQKISAAKKIRNFQRFHILMIYYNYAFTWLLMPVVFVWIPGSLIIACGFASIRFHSFLSFFEYIPFPVLVYNCCVILAVTMHPATIVYEESNKLYQTLLHDNNMSRRKSRLRRKELAALRPFGVKIGFIQRVKKVAILVSYYFVSNHIFTMLITFPEDQINH